MKKRVISVLLAVAVCASLLVGCGGKEPETTEAPAATEENAEATEEATGEKEALEFYHGYFHEESEWPAAKVFMLI